MSKHDKVVAWTDEFTRDRDRDLEIIQHARVRLTELKRIAALTDEANDTEQSGARRVRTEKL